LSWIRPFGFSGGGLSRRVFACAAGLLPAGEGARFFLPHRRVRQNPAARGAPPAAGENHPDPANDPFRPDPDCIRFSAQILFLCGAAVRFPPDRRVRFRGAPSVSGGNTGRIINDPRDRLRGSIGFPDCFPMVIRCPGMDRMPFFFLRKSHLQKTGLLSITLS
jgi:hypothetical protein